MISIAAAQNNQGVIEQDSNKVDLKNSINLEDLPENTANEAKKRASVELCVRYLHDKYPNAAAVRLNAICQRLRAQIQAGNIDKKDITQAMRLNEARLRAFANLDKEKKNLVLNMNPEARARLAKLNDDKLQKLLNLKKAQLEKIKHMTRAKIKELSEKDPAEIRKALGRYKVRTVKKTELYRKRVVAVNKMQEAAQRYNRAREKYQNAKNKLNQARSKFKEAVESGDEEKAVEYGKNYLLHTADLSISALEKIKANIEDNDDLSEEEAAEMIDELDGQIAEHEPAKDNVEAA